MARLRFAVRKFDPFEQALLKFWHQYKELHAVDADIEFVPLDLEGLYDALFVRQGLRNGDWDLVHINTDWIAQAFEQGGLHVLNEDLDRNPPEDYAGAWSSSLLGFQNFEGQIVGLPFHDGPECLVIRKDLFENEKEQQQFFNMHKRELAVPKTWEDFLLVAEFFTRPQDNLYGTVFAGYPDGHNAVFDFCIQLWSRGGELLDRHGQIRLDQTTAVEALDFYRSLFRDKRCLHPSSATYESVQAGEAFARGEVAMMVNWFGFASWAQIDSASAVRGQVDIAPIPANKNIPAPSLNVYWLYAIAEGSKHKALAYDFIRFAVAKEQDKASSLGGAVGCRYSTWYDADINARIPFYNKLAALHETARTLPRIAHWPDVAHIIDHTVTSAIHSEKDSLTLLKEAQEKLSCGGNGKKHESS